MELCEINPFLRYAELQPSVLSSAPLSCSYDYRIFYIVEGTARLVLSNRSLPLSAGMLLYFRPGTPYYFDGKIKVIVLNFDLTRRHTNIKTLPPPPPFLRLQAPWKEVRKKECQPCPHPLFDKRFPRGSEAPPPQDRIR